MLGDVSTFAGNFNISGFKDGIGTQAAFQLPQGITVDKQGVLYIADSSNNCIRQILPTGTVC